jgi:dTMP kinase
MFIVFEGIDGCGKSTQAARFVTQLRARRRSVLHLREPGATALGERLREIVLHRDEVPLSARAEGLLYSTARAELVGSTIAPALARGETVVCERYFYSTLAYQGYGLGLDLDALRAISRFATADLLPDRVVLLDLSPAVAVTRRSARGDRIESRGEEYFDRVRQGFLALAAEDPRRFSVVDASAAQNVVAAAIDEVLADAVR